MTSPTPIHERMQPLWALAGELEASDADTSGHSRRVARHATLIASRLGLATDTQRRIRTAALLHDVGKISVPLPILHKPGPLTPREFEVIKGHAARGAQMVQESVGDPRLAEIVRHHHERFDGAGYPDGLAGAEIPLGARVIAVADTFDAVVSRRPYRRAGSFDQALTELAAASGTQLDPEIVAVFCAASPSRRSMGSLGLLSDAGGEPMRGSPWRVDAQRVPLDASRAA